ncbi:MAG: hypothetical protein ABSG37_11830 [Candidatus Limnocylindrales bacterium]
MADGPPHTSHETKPEAVAAQQPNVAARLAAGQISAAEARTAPDRNVLTRSIGSEPEVLVDIFGPRQLQPGERLVLCTDGVHGMIDDAEIGRLASSLPIGQSAGALVTAAVEAGGRDNATALVGGYGRAAAGVGPVPAAALARTGHRPPVRAVVAAMLVIVALAPVTFVVSGGFGSPAPSPTPTRSPSVIPTLSQTAVPTAAATPASTTAPTITQAAPTPAPAVTTPASPLLTVTLTGTGPSRSPGNGNFTVTSLEGASCKLSAKDSQSHVQVSGPFLIGPSGVHLEPWGSVLGPIHGSEQITVTCTKDGQSAKDRVSFTWP